MLQKDEIKTTEIFQKLKLSREVGTETEYNKKNSEKYVNINLAKWLEHLTANANVESVLGSILVSSRKMMHC